MQIIGLYAAILTLLFVTLSMRTIRLRRSLKIGIGDNGNKLLLRAMRTHSNFAEYVPISLILIALVEIQKANLIFVHALGLVLCLGRFIHAFGVSQEKEDFRFRVSGMVLTFVVLLSSSAFLIWNSATATLN